MPSNSSKSRSIRPRDDGLKPIIVKSEVRSASERGASSPLIVVYGFLALILLGAILLILPFSHNEPISFIDALFTATSASTVTGLIVLDTATTWTLFGQIVIAFLIVIGGIGSIKGAFVGALLVGMTDTMGRFLLPSFFSYFFDNASATSIGSSIASMSIYILMAIVLVFRPSGLYGNIK